MPSLSARPDDLINFANSYLEYFAGQIGRKLDGFSKEAIGYIQEYGWPGNLRELRNAIERAVILAEGSEIQPMDLPIDVSSCNGATPSIQSVHVGAHLSLEKLEREHIRRVVDTSNSLAIAAETLGIDQATLYRKRKKMNLG
ncbi:MAG: NtrC-family two-component system response regulator AlgB [Verrucomicrobiales bacterium]|jgi:NtrC-family two-component system response regulator AlgB